MRIKLIRRIHRGPFDPKSDYINPRRLQLAAQIKEAARPVMERVLEDPNHTLVPLRVGRLVPLVPHTLSGRLRCLTLLIESAPIWVAMIPGSTRGLAIDVDGNLYVKALRLRTYDFSDAVITWVPLGDVTSSFFMNDVLGEILHTLQRA